MKVIQINTTANKGSTGRIAEQIGSLIIENAGESIICYGRDSNLSQSKLYKIGNEFDVKLHGLQSLFLGRHGQGSILATNRLINFIKEQNPDIIHLHNLHGYYLNYPLLFNFLNKSRIKILWTLHDCWAFTGHCTYFSDINCDKWKTECNSCPKTGNYPKSLLIDNSTFFFDLKKELFNSVSLNIVTVSHWLKNLVEQSFLKKQNIRVIYNGVDGTIFKPQGKNELLLSKYNLKGKSVLLAASTSWAKQKGFEDYLKLAKYLAFNEVIVLLGLPSHLRNKLPINIIAVDIIDNINELVSWYNIADIVLNLSYQETFGLTSVEGFMCGKPTILYNSTASPELIVDEILGEIVESGDILEVYEAIKRIYSKNVKSEDIREIALKIFDAKRQYAKYIDLYNSILR